jgi:hypothetical protein
MRASAAADDEFRLEHDLLVRAGRRIVVFLKE